MSTLIFVSIFCDTFLKCFAVIYGPNEEGEDKFCEIRLPPV